LSTSGLEICSLRVAVAASVTWSAVYWIGVTVPVLAFKMWKARDNQDHRSFAYYFFKAMYTSIYVVNLPGMCGN
jgi:hypothetical protein